MCSELLNRKVTNSFFGEEPSAFVSPLSGWVLTPDGVQYWRTDLVGSQDEEFRRAAARMHSTHCLRDTQGLWLFEMGQSH